MSIAAAATKHAIHDKIESRIKLAEANLEALKAKAETARADLEIKAIANLAAERLEIHQRFEELKKAADNVRDRLKKDLETRVSAFEKSIKGIESRLMAH